jgi:cysteine desulfurase
VETAYLDHAASTPVRADVVQAMLPWLTECYANPTGAHRMAREARRALDDSRSDIADLLGVDLGDVVFCGNGSEADNMAILGAHACGGGSVVTSAAEHHAVLHTVEHLDGDARIVRTGPDGSVDLAALRDALDDTVTVVSVMTVNNEVGTVTPMEDVARLVRRRAPKAVLHTDAVQAHVWMDLAPVMGLVDAMSLSAHKFGGPKGVGVLVVKPHVRLAPLAHGGGQERGRRPGTQDVAGAVAMATAMARAAEERATQVVRIGALRDRLVDGLRTALDGVHESVPRDRKVAGNAHVCIEGVDSESLLFLAERSGVMASAGSSCSSGAVQVSHVLAAMGVGRDRARGAVRFSLASASTDADVDRVLDVVPGIVEHLRRSGL